MTTQAGSGLLDLSVDLSTPEVFSGKEFSVFLRIKNPFSVPIWIQGVTVNVPSAVEWLDRPSAQKSEGGQGSIPGDDVALNSDFLRQFADSYATQRQALLDRIKEVGDEDQGRAAWELGSQVRQLDDQQLPILGMMHASSLGRTVISVGSQSSVDLDISKITNPTIFTGIQSRLNLRSDPEQVPLSTSLPINSALQPGNSAVWTIRFATKSDLFFLPSKYRLEFTVLFSFDDPSRLGNPAPGQNAQAVVVIQSNNTSLDLRIRSSVWSTMIGSCVGAVLGSAARALQVNKTLGNFVSNVESLIPAMLLAVILGVAATIFSARKSEIQSFVTVEDFWGGALIGFLVGYSGTAAFQNLTGVEAGT